MTKAATKARRKAAREAMVIAAIAFEGVEDVAGHTGWKFMCGGVNVTRTVFDLERAGILSHRLRADGSGNHDVYLNRRK